MNIDEMKERIWKDPKIMRECLNDCDLASFLTASYGPRGNDPLEFGERVLDWIDGAVTAVADDMMRDEEEIVDCSEDERLDDPRHGQAELINRMERGLE